MVTLCTSRFKLKRSYVLRTEYMYVPYGSQSRQRLYHCKRLSDLFCYEDKCVQCVARNECLIRRIILFGLRL